ncbi:MAG: HAMP domain-containing sensor histidine kinase [Pirellulaceae bacterium]|jgi:signal transduction histidine kinase|nr:HAMP domain-containing sensor histidine kinase [Pirellulaceae bacterium]MDP7015454.1 HAMP domain-containing sensor histidine kinase [Pirellulaceae bacterium]
MKHPWQIWSLYGCCSLVVFVAMAWLTSRALELDRAESIARRRALQEEEVSAALWTLDVELSRLLAPEIARPLDHFQPFLAPAAGKSQSFGGKSPAQSVEPQQPAHVAVGQPSPLLLEPKSPYVKLHFQLRSNEQWTSPECPESDYRAAALSLGVPVHRVDSDQRLLADLKQAIRFDTLADMLPLEAAEMALAAQMELMNGPMDLANANPIGRGGNSTLYDGQISAQAGQQQQLANVAQSKPQQQAANRQLRQAYELLSRRAQFRNQVAANQMEFVDVLSPEAAVDERVTQALWYQSDLLLARLVSVHGELVIQGCWLDWPAIRGRLIELLHHQLADADLQPVQDMSKVKLSRVMATLPVQVVTPPVAPGPSEMTPVRVSLLIAWGFLGLTAFALAFLLHGVSTLSERRASFVSAVTHELRTPLTTFRMYAEMLSTGMVSEPKSQREYLQTLGREADRLTHLVENVLQYARLERGRTARSFDEMSVGELHERVAARLRERLAQVDMELVVALEDGCDKLEVKTDASAVEQILFNLVDNACKYAVRAEDRRVHLEWSTDARRLVARVIDHGPGISTTGRKRLFRPFSKSADEAARSAPGVGLGLALSRRLARDLGGELKLESPSGGGGGGPGARFALRLPRE